MAKVRCYIFVHSPYFFFYGKKRMLIEYEGCCFSKSKSITWEMSVTESRKWTLGNLTDWFLSLLLEAEKDW